MSPVGNAPLSPISVGGSEWSLSQYPSREEGPYTNGRGNLVSPPNSGGSIGTMSMNGFPSGPRSAGGPSPPPSIGRSSTGTNAFSAGSDGGHNSTRGGELDEAVLGEHYIALRAFLNARDNNARQQPNKARDKLLRLSSVQFFELSTDVFDELMRRQAMARAGGPNAPNGPPQFLLPEKTFHPKRNQARQRLSSLGPPRFRDLAADVYHELERRFPTFVGRDIPRGGSSMSMRGGPMSRTGTPANGMFPPRGQSRMRKPSESGSIRGPPSAPDIYNNPPSPNIPNGDYGRPLPKQVNQNNTIVPNKSTMLEEDDESPAASEVDKKLMEDYEAQISELQDQLADMQDAMKKKDDEINSALESERSRATVTNMEKKEWAGLRLDLEKKLAEAQDLNRSMKDELDRLRSEQEQHASAKPDFALQQENDKLRESLRQQEQVTEEVRREAQEFLQEMRVLSQQSAATYDRQLELEKTIEELERDVQDWRTRYARSKTQQGGMRASTLGLSLDYDAGKQIRNQEFIADNGVIRDFLVTQFQMSIDELLQTAHKEAPEKAPDSMNRVIVSVRQITKALDKSTLHDDDIQRQGKLRSRVAATANALITACRNFEAGAGLSPVSLLDAAASNLTAAIVELLRLVKIRPTPPGEIRDDDDGTITPVDSASFFSPRSTTQPSTQGGLPPPPPFQGLGGAGARASAESSAYSPISSPRESVDPYPVGGLNGSVNGGGYMGLGKGPNGYHDSRADDLKVYLDDQTALLVSDIQNLVSFVRSDAEIGRIITEILSINATVGKILDETQSCGYGSMAARLGAAYDRLTEAYERGRDLAQSAVVQDDTSWRKWTQTLPPIAFEIARETKELGQRISGLSTSGGVDEFS
ncbi:Spa2-like protein [Metarhizium rileyi]|uniref:Component of the polarisome n=1 Tax=Metarhizium rileyi (strain RCEF 4871) TaxID=1649241 RepID=A0A162JNL5_METRR|nr:Spa2-like protein [Metarhizium rileyi RCEF 4871]TWU70768.1 component of the polarisome [Metarhizium rileyi]